MSEDCYNTISFLTLHQAYKNLANPILVCFRVVHYVLHIIASSKQFRPQFMISKKIIVGMESLRTYDIHIHCETYAQ